MKETYYKCKKCWDVWGFSPEDYDGQTDYPDVCPLCSMPITQMIRDVYEVEGVWEVLKMVWLRVKNIFRK
jgi:hypothetical protein